MEKLTIDANQASMKKINALEKEAVEELVNKVNNHNSITEELSNKINVVLERGEQYRASNNLVQKYNDKIEQIEPKLKAENLSQQDIAKLQQEKINLETKIEKDVKDRTNKFLQNSISLHGDLGKLQQQQQLYEDAPNRIESINSKLRKEIAFNDIIKKDLEQFSKEWKNLG